MEQSRPLLCCHGWTEHEQRDFMGSRSIDKPIIE